MVGNVKKTARGWQRLRARASARKFANRTDAVVRGAKRKGGNRGN